MGRFLSIDPILISFSRRIDPQRLNAYGYVRNNPHKYVDPDGMDLKLASSLKKGEQDRMIRNAIKLYRKESGRQALEKLEKSKTTYEIRAGSLPNKTSDVGVMENYGLTKPDGTLTASVQGGKIIAIHNKDTLTVGITMDIGKLDQTQSDILTGKRVVGTLPSESEVFSHEIGHAEDFEDDPVRQHNQEISEDEKKANEFAKKVRKEKDSLSEDEAEKRVREIFGLPPKRPKEPKDKPNEKE